MEAIERATGALIGMFVGDGLGVQAEGMDAETLQQEFPEGLSEMYSTEREFAESGELTDGSVLAILLARSIIDIETYDVDHVRSAYRTWYKIDPTLTYPQLQGILTEDEPLSTKINYSLMRIAPLGVLGTNASEKEIAAMVERECSMSDSNTVSIDTCKAFCWAIAEAIRGVEHNFKLGVYLLSTAKKFNLDEAVQAAIQRAIDGKVAPTPTKKNSAFFPFEAALYALLHTSSFEEGMMHLIMQGGNAHANAIVYGALAGSWYSHSLIPSRWQGELHVPDSLAKYMKKLTTFRRQNLNPEFLAETMAEQLLQLEV